MTDAPHKPPTAARPTRERLIAAAGQEFNARGFHGTDTNRIARRAGFAPQTFYRHFADKTEMFIEVYRHWRGDEERAVAEAIRAHPARADRGRVVASALLASHRAWRGFRRSLRLLAVEDPRVRSARTESRLAQLAAAPESGDANDRAGRVAALLTIERLCDAAADDETGDLAVDGEDWLALVAEAVARLRRTRPEQAP
jgi:AcrR family transcriptional regulator